MGLVIIAGVLAGVVILIVVGARWAVAAVQRRRDRLVAEPAAQLGLAPVPALPDDLPPFELLNTGSNRGATAIVRGTVRGTDVVMFDYCFHDSRPTGYTGLRYRKHFANMTIACARGSWLNLPAFSMEPHLGAILKDAEAQVTQQLGDGAMAGVAKRLMSIAEGIVGAQSGMPFTDRPDVKYIVRQGDEAAVRAIFTPPILDFFRDHPGWIVEGRGDWILVTFTWQFRQHLDLQQQRTDAGWLAPEQLGALVRAATDTVDAFRAAAR
jgi:hypothetical protein